MDAANQAAQAAAATANAAATAAAAATVNAAATAAAEGHDTVTTAEQKVANNRGRNYIERWVGKDVKLQGDKMRRVAIEPLAVQDCLACGVERFSCLPHFCVEMEACCRVAAMVKAHNMLKEEEWEALIESEVEERGTTSPDIIKEVSCAVVNKICETSRGFTHTVIKYLPNELKLTDPIICGKKIKSKSMLDLINDVRRDPRNKADMHIEPRDMWNTEDSQKLNRLSVVNANIGAHWATPSGRAMAFIDHKGPERAKQVIVLMMKNGHCPAPAVQFLNNESIELAPGYPQWQQDRIDNDTEMVGNVRIARVTDRIWDKYKDFFPNGYTRVKALSQRFVFEAVIALKLEDDLARAQSDANERAADDNATQQQIANAQALVRRKRRREENYTQTALKRVMKVTPESQTVSPMKRRRFGSLLSDPAYHA